MDKTSDLINAKVRVQLAFKSGNVVPMFMLHNEWIKLRAAFLEYIHKRQDSLRWYLILGTENAELPLDLSELDCAFMNEVQESRVTKVQTEIPKNIRLQ